MSGTKVNNLEQPLSPLSKSKYFVVAKLLITAQLQPDLL